MSYSFTVPELNDPANIQTALNNFGASVGLELDKRPEQGTEFKGKVTVSVSGGTTSAVGKIYVQSTQPSSPSVGDIWMW